MDTAAVLSNTMLSKDLYLIRVKNENTAKMGQFYMLRAWGTYPLLSRPISVFDSDGQTVSFLYRTVGEGTQMLAALRNDDKLTLAGPYGNPFPTVGGRVALVGGGVGIAPLYLAAKTPMMKALYRRCEGSSALLYVSLESRMACGIGACLGCSCPTVDGNRRICKDGPVFLAREVF